MHKGLLAHYDELLSRQKRIQNASMQALLYFCIFNDWNVYIYREFLFFLYLFKILFLFFRLFNILFFILVWLLNISKIKLNCTYDN